MELAWHTQKNQMSDVKGKEMEQERKGKIKNEDIDLDRTKFNYDLVSSNKNLYQRVKERVEFAKETGSRVQKNSVVMYSNILTVPQDQFEKWGEQKTKDYFKACYEFFSNEFGKENVVSAKVHLDETAPHMHLHFVPFNKETGKLQARVVMTPKKISEVHDSLPKFLRERGFEVERGSGKTKQNIEDIHEYKKVQKVIQEKKQELEKVQLQVEKIVQSIPTKEELNLPLLEKEKQVTVIQKVFGKNETIETETENFVVTPSQYKMIEKRLIVVETLKKQNEHLVKENAELKSGEAFQNLVKQNRKLVNENSKYGLQILEMKNQQEELLKGLVEENRQLEQKNKALFAKVEELKMEIRLFYLTAKDYLKQRINTPEAFQNVFKGLLRTFKEHVGVFATHNENKAFKSHLNEIYDSDKDFVPTQQKKTPERDFGGMER